MTRPRIATTFVALAAAAALTLAACGSGSSAGGAAAGGSSSGGAGASAAVGGPLHVYAWAGEIPDSVVQAFEKETGVKVTLDTFDSNETMTAKLAAGNSGYDVVEPSQYAVQQLIGQNLVEPLDHSKLTGLDNIATKFLDPSYDKGNAYSVPWVWGTTGLLYNEKCTGGPITSWKSLQDPKFKGKVYLLDNMLAAYIVGLQLNGFKASSTDKGQIETATSTLTELKKNLAGFNATNYAQLVDQGQACIAEAWGGTGTAKVVTSNPDVHFVLPSEGGTLWTDNLSIVKGAKNTANAYAFLNFLLRPEVAALATDDGSMATANQAAKTKITKTDLVNNAAVYAPEDQIAKSDFIVDPGPAMTFFQQGWTKVKAS